MKGAWGDGVSIGQDWRHGGESRSDPAGLFQAAVRGWALKGQRGAGVGGAGSVPHLPPWTIPQQTSHVSPAPPLVGAQIVSAALVSYCMAALTVGT